MIKRIEDESQKIDSRRNETLTARIREHERAVWRALICLQKERDEARPATGRKRLRRRRFEMDKL